MEVMEVNSKYDYALQIRFEWVPSRYRKKLWLVVSGRPPFRKVLEEKVYEKIYLLIDKIDELFWNKVNVDFVKDDINTAMFIIKMNSNWLLEEEIKRLNIILSRIVSNITM